MSFGGRRDAKRGGKVGWLTISALAAMSLALAACQNMVASSAKYYNSGLSESFNSLLLANIVRAAKGYPTYYSAVGDYSSSTSATSSPTVGIAFPVSDPSLAGVDASLGPSFDRDRNANIASLETKDFTLAMEQPISPELFIFIVKAHSGANLNLAISLVTADVVLTREELDRVIGDAVSVCALRYETLSRLRQGICSSLDGLQPVAACPQDPVPVLGTVSPRLLKLRNDPSNVCEYHQFRAFIEALALHEITVGTNDDDKLELSIVYGTSVVPLFTADGTGITFRSPAGMIRFLGDIVRESFENSGGTQPCLTAPSGRCVPIFVVKTGRSQGNTEVAARVEDVEYWVPKRVLGEGVTDFSHPALAIVKDFITLNTSQDQLPKNPTFVIDTTF